MTTTEEKTLKKAIKDKCIDCVGGMDNKDCIKKCPIKKCPLFEYRPYKIVK